MLSSSSQGTKTDFPGFVGLIRVCASSRCRTVPSPSGPTAGGLGQLGQPSSLDLQCQLTCSLKPGKQLDE